MKRVWPKAAKKANRIAAEGMAYATVCESAASALSSRSTARPTSAQSPLRSSSSSRISAKVVLRTTPADVAALMACKYPGTDLKVSEVLPEKVMSIGENLQIRRFHRFDKNTSVSYVHAGGKIGVLVNLEVEGRHRRDHHRQGHRYADRSAEPPFLGQEPRDRRRSGRREEDPRCPDGQRPKMASKPQQVKEKIAAGKINKFYEENCLLQQPFVKDGAVSVEQYMAAAAKAFGGKVKFVDAVRFERARASKRSRKTSLQKSLRR